MDCDDGQCFLQQVLAVLNTKRHRRKAKKLAAIFAAPAYPLQRKAKTEQVCQVLAAFIAE